MVDTIVLCAYKGVLFIGGRGMFAWGDICMVFFVGGYYIGGFVLWGVVCKGKGGRSILKWSY